MLSLLSLGVWEEQSHFLFFSSFFLPSMFRLSSLLRKNKKLEQIPYEKVCKLLCYEESKERDQPLGFGSLSRRNDSLTAILDYLCLSDVISVLITLQKISPKISFYPSKRLYKLLLLIALKEEICFDTADLPQTMVLTKPETTLDGLHRLYRFVREIPIELSNSTLWHRGSIKFTAPGMEISLNCNQCQKDKSTDPIFGMMFGAICARCILWKCPVCGNVADTCKEHSQICCDCGQTACDVCFAGAEFDVIEEEDPLCKNCGFWCTSCLETCSVEDKIVCAGPLGAAQGCPFNHECCGDCTDEMNIQFCDLCR